jgi:oxaloacetate decarboxylase gamma subunit
MMMSDQLAEAGILMGVGMVVVFTFLTLLIGGVHAIAWFARVFPQPDAPAHRNNALKYSQNKNKNSTQTTVNPSIVKAITAAVNTHRREQAK